MNLIPASLQGVLWSQSTKQLDLQKDKTYIIHQILRFGNLEDIRWLKTAYDPETIRHTFLAIPQPVYSKASLRFVKNAILNLEEQSIDESKYIQSFN